MGCGFRCELPQRTERQPRTAIAFHLNHRAIHRLRWNRVRVQSEAQITIAGPLIENRFSTSQGPTRFRHLSLCGAAMLQAKLSQGPPRAISARSRIDYTGQRGIRFVRSTLGSDDGARRNERAIPPRAEYDGRAGVARSS